MAIYLCPDVTNIFGDDQWVIDEQKFVAYRLLIDIIDYSLVLLITHRVFCYNPIREWFTTITTGKEELYMQWGKVTEFIEIQDSSQLHNNIGHPWGKRKGMHHIDLMGGGRNYQKTKCSEGRVVCLILLALKFYCQGKSFPSELLLQSINVKMKLFIFQALIFTGIWYGLCIYEIGHFTVVCLVSWLGFKARLGLTLFW